MTTSQELTQRPAFDDDVLSRIGSFEDALAAFQEAGLVPEKVTDYGTGFSVLSKAEKKVLVSVPFLILDWTFNTSKDYFDENGNPLEFVSATVVTKHGDKYILNDGSTGIAKQLRNVTDKRLERGNPHPQSGLMCDKGLTVSEYDVEDAKGQKSRAETYYLGE